MNEFQYHEISYGSFVWMPLEKYVNTIFTYSFPLVKIKI